MRSSRSKRNDLNLLATEEQSKGSRLNENLHKSHGGFSSFFGRSRRSKSPTFSIKIGSPEPIGEEFASPEATTRLNRRSSLGLGRYKSTSRSMSDLNAVMLWQGNTEDPSDLSACAPTTSPSPSSSRIPSPRKPGLQKHEEMTPFTLSTITRYGWLNKRGTKREMNMKLHRVFLRESKLYAYKPPTDLLIRAFDLEKVSATPRDEISNPIAGMSLEGALHPSDFDLELQEVLFDVRGVTVVNLFSCAEPVLEKDTGEPARSRSHLLAVLTAKEIVICRKPVPSRPHTSSPLQTRSLQSIHEGSSSDKWFLDDRFGLSTTEISFQCSATEDALELRLGSNSRIFVSSTQVSLQGLYDSCVEQQRKVRAEARPSTAPTELISAPVRQVPNPEICSDRDAKPLDVHQITKDSRGTIVQGNFAGLVRQMLLEKSGSTTQPLTNVLLHTIGLWASAEVILNEICKQLNTLAESATKGRAAHIVQTLLNTATSLLLDSRTVEALLKLVGFSEIEEQQILKEELWFRRSQLLNVITTDLSHQSSPLSTRSDSSWAAEYETLSTSGLQAESVLAIPADLFARQLHIFHRYYLKRWNPAKDKSMFFSSQQRGASRNPLVFSHHKMHFLTATILSHILCIDTRPASSKKRAAICTQWILIGMISKRLGDMTGWLATVMALCAPSVARLKEMWTLVEDRLRLVVEKEWSPVMRDLFRRSFGASAADITSAHVLAPDATGLQSSMADVVPFYGDLCDAVEAFRERVLIKTRSGSTIDVAAVTTADEVLSAALASYEAFLAETIAGEAESADDRFTTVPAFQDCFKQLNSMPDDVFEVCSANFLEASARCEKTRDDDLSLKKDSAVYSLGTITFVPLVFNDQLPCYRLFDASDLLEIGDQGKRPKLQSTTSTVWSSQPNVGGIPMRRLNSFPPTQRPANYTTGHGQLDASTRARTAASISQWKMMRHVRDLTGVADRLVTSSSGDLILKDSETEAGSSRRRPQSILMEARNRNSTVSRRSSVQMAEPLLVDVDDDLVIKPSRRTTRGKIVRELVVKAGTLDVLIDLLIFDLNDIKDLNIVDSSDGKSLAQTVHLDRLEYLRTFLVSHRSYCTSVVLLSELSTRLARATSTSSIDGSNDALSEHGTTRDNHIDWSRCEKQITGVFEVISTWLNLVPCDFTSSPAIFVQLENFLRQADLQVVALQKCSEGENAAALCRDLSVSHLKRIRKQVLRVHHRPQFWALPTISDKLLEIYEPFSITRLTTTTDLCDAVKHIDTIVESVLHAITLDDWMSCYELLEMQALEARGFYKSITELMLIDQEIVIHDSVWVLENTTIGDSGHTLLHSMPLPIRKLIHLRTSITNWTIEQISDPNINLETRVNKVRLFLRMLEISGKYMGSFDIEISAQTGMKTQIVPSFIASAISAGLVSPQSRLFSLCWNVVAHAAGTEADVATLQSLVPTQSNIPEPYNPIVPCIAWLVDRMLEIACYIPDKLIENPRLINFDKRRYIYNLLTNLDLIGSASGRVQIQDDLDDPFLFLLGSPSGSPELRSLRSAAQRENQGARHTRLQRPFAHLVQQEHEKARRDLRYRDIIDKQLRELQKSILRKRPDNVKVVEPLKRPATRARYGMNSLLRAVRPLSVAISNNWTPERQSGLARIVAPDDLPMSCNIPRGSKPALTIDLVNAMAQVYNAAENIFRVRTEDGLETYFQATSSEDMDAWVKELSHASIDGAKKRRTTIREDAKLAAIEEAPQFSPRHSMVVNTTTAVFAIDLPILVRRDGSSIPRIAAALMNEIERRGLHEVGIYRISGSLSTVNALKAAFDSGREVNLEDARWSDINAIASVFKLWLRELPEPLMTYALYDSFLATLQLEDYTARSLCLKELVHKLPVPNFSVLKRLIEHLEKITDYETTNHMYAHNLAIVFGPNVLQPVPSLSSFASSMNDLGKVQTIIRNLILQCHWIFVTDDEAEEPEMAKEIGKASPQLPPIVESGFHYQE